jgi:maltose O-acetyltransferase
MICRVLFVFVRNWPPSYCKAFPFGAYLRNALARGMLDECGKGVNIESGARFGSGAGIRVGDFSGIGIRAEVNTPATIGRYVMMAPEVVILTQNHHHSRTDVPMALQGHDCYEGVVIEDDVWIGQRAIILPGVRIGTGSIIGAGAVVAKDVPPYSLVVGNPGRVVRSRQQQLAAEAGSVE